MSCMSWRCAFEREYCASASCMLSFMEETSAFAFVANLSDVRKATQKSSEEDKSCFVL